MDGIGDSGREDGDDGEDEVALGRGGPSCSFGGPLEGWGARSGPPPTLPTIESLGGGVDEPGDL